MKIWSNKQKRVLAAAVTALLLMAALDARLKLVQYKLHTDKLTGPVRICLLTDLHGCAYGAGQQTLIEAIAAQTPDLVLLGGDIYDDKVSYLKSDELLQAIAAQYPCYYVSGNHEANTGEVRMLKQRMRDYGVTVLEGTFETVEIRGQRINLCGVDDPMLGGMPKLKTQLEDVAAACDNGAYTVLLAHRPDQIEQYLEHDFDLVLCGHTHGGQWRIPGVLNGLLAPGQGLFPEYGGGQYDFADASMIISRGLARESTRVPRVCNRPELVMIELSDAT